MSPRDRPETMSLASIDGERLPGDPARVVGGEEQHRRGDVLRRAEAPQGDVASIELLLSCPAAPSASHCRSVVGFERTKPGATVLTVMPKGPSSWASCRVSPIWPGLGAGVGLDAGEAEPEPRARRDVDDAAPAGRLHAGRRAPRHQEGARQVHVDDRLPVASSETSSMGAADLPEHAAGVVDQDVGRHASLRRQVREQPLATAVASVTSSGVGHAAAPPAPRSRRGPRPGRRRRSRRRRRPQASAMARPKPCAAPVTSAVRPARSILTARPRRLRGRRGWRAPSGRRPSSMSWMRDTIAAVIGVGTPCRAGRSPPPVRAARRPRCAPAHREVAPDARMGFQRAAVVRHHGVEGARGQVTGGARGRRLAGSKPSKPSSRTPSARDTATTSWARRVSSRAVLRRRQHVGDGDRRSGRWRTAWRRRSAWPTGSRRC